ncbi:DUF4062 domain-containing protein [Prescottella equi]|uniref:DUF4062 domain-containing protein n=1 Tax=Rhodococcus hoagii TaxID=43767 RepID=UPI0015856A83|nr:DUF4062 domain-containing protein [Prescottella equi]
MGIERRYQVFVSSTYVDLIEERREVMQVLLEQECIPAGMELFVASDEDQWSLITEVIDLSDYYVLIVGGRYGSTVDGISYTEKEFDYAVGQGKTVLVFVHQNPGAIPAEKTELGDEAREKLQAFRDKVTTGRMVKFFNNAQELGSLVGRSLHRAFKKNPAEGWVRGSMAMTPETEAELARLRTEVAELKLERAETRSDTSIDSSAFQQGRDSVDLHYQHNAGENGEWETLTMTVTWDALFKALGPKLMNECTESTMRSSLNTAFKYDAQDKGVPLERSTRVVILGSTWDRIKIHFHALGWVEEGKKKRPINDSSVYLRLTKAGEKHLIHLMAARVETKLDDLDNGAVPDNGGDHEVAAV